MSRLPPALQCPRSAATRGRPWCSSRRWRKCLRRKRACIAAERGHWREGGSLLFHTSFYLLLIGIVWGQVLGFRGQINIAEGKPFAETALAYDLWQPGRLWDVEDHRGFVVTLDDFDVSYFDNLTPADFVSTVTI